MWRTSSSQNAPAPGQTYRNLSIFAKEGTKSTLLGKPKKSSLVRWLTIPPADIQRLGRVTTGAHSYNALSNVYGAVKLTAVLGWLYHFSFACLFFILGRIEQLPEDICTWMGLFNVCFSLPAFTAALYFAHRGRVDYALALGSLEVVVHSCVATVACGWVSIPSPVLCFKWCVSGNELYLCRATTVLLPSIYLTVR